MLEIDIIMKKVLIDFFSDSSRRKICEKKQRKIHKAIIPDLKRVIKQETDHSLMDAIVKLDVLVY